MRAKGRCFELAAKHLLDDPSWTLVHGYAQLVAAFPFRMAHAWLEKGSRVYDPTRTEEPLMSLRRYRAKYRACAERRYRAREARKLLLTHEHFGPWDACIHDLIPLGLSLKQYRRALSTTLSVHSEKISCENLRDAQRHAQ